MFLESYYASCRGYTSLLTSLRQACDSSTLSYFSPGVSGCQWCSTHLRSLTNSVHCTLTLHCITAFRNTSYRAIIKYKYKALLVDAVTTATVYLNYECEIVSRRCSSPVGVTGDEAAGATPRFLTPELSAPANCSAHPGAFGGD